MLASAAAAGELRVDGTRIVYAGAGGEAEQLKLIYRAAGPALDAVGPGVTAGAGCSVVTADDGEGNATVRCPAGGIEQVDADAGDDDDVVTFLTSGTLGPPMAVAIRAGVGDDTVTVESAGTFTVDGGAGDDQLQAPDIAAATLVGGEDSDRLDLRIRVQPPRRRRRR